MTDLVEFAAPPVNAAIGGPGSPPDDRLARNAAALVVSGILTSGLGFAFWVLAARVLTPDDVGIGTALVAAVVLLANISTLGLRSAFPRFIPVAGASTRRLVGRGYLACAVVAVVLSTGFVLGSSLWAQHLSLLRTEWIGGLCFVVATAGWTVFVLQDSVLTGLRRATWVPIENFVYAVAKIAILVVVVSTGRWALLLAWAIPAIAVLVPLNALIFRRLIPAHEAAAAAGRAVGSPAPRFDWRALGRFSAGEHTADVIKNFGAEGVVLVALAAVGAAQSSALFFGLMISASIQLVTSNIVNAFVAEAAARPGDVDSLLRRSAFHIARLVVPAALVGAALAPIALAVFGAAYASNGASVLRLLLLALVPQIVVSLAVGVARFERRIGLIVMIAAATALAPLCGAVLLAPRFGIVAIGWSVLLGQTALAVVLVGSVFRHRVVDAMPAVVFSPIVGIRDWTRHRRRVRAVGSILDELDAVHKTVDPLSPRRVVRNTTDVVVVIVDHPTNPRVIKIALSSTAAYGLTDHAQAVRALRAAAAGAERDVGAVLPTVLEAGSVVGHSYLIETRCEGLPPLVADHGTLHAAAEALLQLHRLTEARTTVGDSIVLPLVDQPIDVLVSDQRLAADVATLERLRVRLDAELRGRRLVTARTHGDFWLGNVLAETVSGRVVVTGVIDWEDSLPAGLPEVDLVHLWLSTQTDGLAGATLRTMHTRILSDVTGPWISLTPNPTLPGGSVVLLAWLSHVASGLDRSTKFGLGRMWLDQNVRPVLEALSRA